MKKFIIGIDVSKEKLDICLRGQEKIIKETLVTNHSKAITACLADMLKGNSVADFLICAESSGQYIYPLCCACEELGIDLWLENPAQIKYRSGIQRGKNDKLDARKIADYALLFSHKARLFCLPEKRIATLKQLISERDMYVCDKAKYKGQLTDQKDFMDKDDYKKKSIRLEKLITNLEIAIEQIEAQIQGLIDNDQTLSRQHELLCSVDGIGDKTAIKMIVETNAFQDFKDPRKFCCHAGVAPFSFESGTSQKSRNKLSNRADKSIKTLLHMAALSATRTQGELHDYYVIKVAAGKNKMSVLNAIRAKLVLRMFAVIKNNQFYQKNYINSLA